MIFEIENDGGITDLAIAYSKGVDEKFFGIRIIPLGENQIEISDNDDKIIKEFLVLLKERKILLKAIED